MFMSLKSLKIAFGFKNFVQNQYQQPCDIFKYIWLFLSIIFFDLLLLMTESVPGQEETNVKLPV